MTKVATWNVNSVRTRLPHIIDFLEKHQPDILALQETKAQDKDFPIEAFIESGYHATISGQKSYNGVALITKNTPTEVITEMPNFPDEQKRVLAGTFSDLRFINLYVPNGTALDSPNFQYKLNWFAALCDYVKEQLVQHKKLVIVGDFNVAPTDLDVHNPKLWKNRLLVTPEERLALQNIIDLGLTDSFRYFNQEDGGFTWWDYRTNGYVKGQGLRIDFILINEKLKETCHNYSVESQYRGMEKPSDHAPVILSI